MRQSGHETCPLYSVSPLPCFISTCIAALRASPGCKQAQLAWKMLAATARSLPARSHQVLHFYRDVVALSVAAASRES